ncbi:MAG: YcfL family protein [Opitutus sp.]|nr:YcfL family protein [Opitutus sp.]
MKTLVSSSLRARLTAGLLLGLGLFAAGCASNVNTVSRAEPQAEPNLIADKRVITDNTLANAIRIVSVNEGVASSNLKRIQVTIENRKNSTRTLSYKFEWVDENGMAVSSPNETWKTIRLLGRETTTISTIAVTPRAVDFTLKLRE